MVAITDRYRRRVEKRYDRRRPALLPMRVSTSAGTIFEGPTMDISDSGVYFRMPGAEVVTVGDRVEVELSIPAELSGSRLGLHTLRPARVVRIDDASLARRVGCRPHDCGVALAFEPAAESAAFSEELLQAASAAVA